MNRVVPWIYLVGVFEPVSPKAEGPGRPPVGIERMLRLHGLPQWFNLSDPAVEEAFEVEFSKEDQKTMRTLAEVAGKVRELQRARQVA